MINRTHITYLPLLIILSLVLSISCKEQKELGKTKSTPQEDITESLAPQYKEIAAFMGLSISDSTDLDKLLVFKALYPKDSLAGSDAAQNLKYYKGIISKGKAGALPVFESRETGLILVLFTGRGYLGPIWAEVLIQRNPVKIIKMRFGHQIESEGSGASIAEAAFEDQFAGREIIFDGNSFSLHQDNKILIEGESAVDGIAGATTTAKSAVAMLNTGFITLADYFNP